MGDLGIDGRIIWKKFQRSRIWGLSLYSSGIG
jgi:hypothetical protein